MKRRLLSLILILAMFCFPIVNANAKSNEETLSDLADKLISKTEITQPSQDIMTAFQRGNINQENDYSLSETTKYDGIQNYVASAKQRGYSENDIAKSLTEHIEFFKIDSEVNFPIEKAKEMLQATNLTSSVSYYRVNELGDKNQVSRAEVEARSNLVSDDKDWSDKDGWMGIRTSAYEVDRVDGRAFVNIIAEQCWFKQPRMDLTDMLAVNSGGTYVNTYDTWGEYYARAHCIKMCHERDNLTRYAYVDKYSTDNKYVIGYLSGSSGAHFSFPLYCGYHYFGDNYHGLTDYISISRIGLQIAIDKGKSINVWSAYLHNTISMFNPTASAGTGGIGIDFGFALGTDEYHAEPLSLYN